MKRRDFLRSAAALATFSIVLAKVLWGAEAQGVTPASLRGAFAHPTDKNRPETYFFFFGGNISKEGITADLEAVRAAGIGGVKLFNGNSARGAWPGVPNQVRCLSEEWDRLIGHYGDECRRLNLRFSMQVCPGWAMAGGPWIRPRDAMRHLSYTRTNVKGGGNVEVRLPQTRGTNTPESNWQDVAVLAFPKPEGDWDRPLAPVSAKGSADGNWMNWLKGHAVMLPANATTKITVDFAEPVTVRTLELPSVKGLASVVMSFTPKTSVRLEADGKTLIPTTDLPPSSWQDARPLSLACPETTAKQFVITVCNKHPINLGTIRFYSAAKKHNWEGEACWTHRRLMRGPHPRQSEKSWVKSSAVTNVTHCMKPDGTFAWEAPEGEWTVLRIGHVNTGFKNIPAPPEGTGWECDKFSAKAADVQFDNYIGRLSKKGGPLSGKLNRMLMDSWECGQQTWTDGMENIFSSRLGYDLFPWLPAVLGYVVDTPGDTERFLNDWRVLVSDLISDEFFGHMSERAHERNMDIEFEAAFGNSIPGDILKYYKYADTPMCEFWQPAVSFDFTPVKTAISGAHVYGKRGVGAEAFTAFRVTWDEKLRDFKHNANMNLAEGITHFVFHTFTHNPQKPWLPPGTSFGGQGIGSTFVRGQTWWWAMPAFTDYFARCQTMLESGVEVRDVLWYLGDECDGRPGHYAQFPAGYRYDLCNPDALLSRFTVNGRGEWQNPEGTCYRVLWLPSCDRLNPETIEHIVAEVGKGGVAALAALPREPATRKGGEDGMKRFRVALNAVAKCCTGRGRIYVGKSIQDVLHDEKVKPDVYGEGVVWNHRRTGKTDSYFVAPAAENKGFNGVIGFRDGGVNAQIWYPETGATEAVRIVSTTNSATWVALDLVQAQACFIVFDKGEPPLPAVPLDTAAFVKSASSLDISKPWTVEFPEGWGMPSRTELSTLKPWHAIGETPEARAFSGTATYRQTFNVGGWKSGQRAVLDLGRVESVVQVELNGRVLSTLWSEPYRLDVTDAIRSGANELKLKVANTWFNRLAYDAGRPEKARRTWTFRWPPKDAQPHDSGLMGPVRLHVR